MSHSELNKLKPGIENGTEVTLNLISNVIGHSNDETNIAHRLLLTNTQVSRLCKAFANNSSANIIYQKLHKNMTIRRILGKVLGF